MSYYAALHLAREPFSNSPDPGLFFHSDQHLKALQQLEISVRLKRGLSVVTGDVGTGKTTLSRQLIQKFSGDDSVRTVFILDPGFASVVDFLAYLFLLLTGMEHKGSRDETVIKEKIKNFLFTHSVDLNRLTVLIIDEGQKLSPECLEALRELLNYETNEHKLLQIVIFAQNEFNDVIRDMNNVKDRINVYFSLGPLDFANTRGLIRYRLEASALPGHTVPVFSLPACWAVYRITRGYPRRIVKLCHHVILSLIISNKKQAGLLSVYQCQENAFPGTRRTSLAVPAVITAGVLLFTGAYALSFLSDFSLTGNRQTSIEAGGQAAGQCPVGDYMAVPQKPVATAEILPVANDLSQVIPAQKTAAAIPPEPVGHPSTMLTQYRPGYPSDPGTGQAAATGGDLFQKTEPGGTTSGVLVRDPMPAQKSQPRLLGTIKIVKNEILCDLLRPVYGYCANSILSEVLAVNPQIRNPSLVFAGAQVHLPIPSFSIRAADDNRHVIILAQSADISIAYEWLRAYRQGRTGAAVLPDEDAGLPGPLTGIDTTGTIPLRILATLDSENELDFFVIVDQYFDSRQAAQEYLDQLPERFAPRRARLSDWGSGTRLLTKRNG